MKPEIKITDGKLVWCRFDINIEEGEWFLDDDFRLIMANQTTTMLVRRHIFREKTRPQLLLESIRTWMTCCPPGDGPACYGAVLKEMARLWPELDIKGSVDEELEKVKPAGKDDQQCDACGKLGPYRVVNDRFLCRNCRGEMPQPTGFAHSNMRIMLDWFDAWLRDNGWSSPRIKFRNLRSRMGFD